MKESDDCSASNISLSFYTGCRGKKGLLSTATMKMVEQKVFMSLCDRRLSHWPWQDARSLNLHRPGQEIHSNLLDPSNVPLLVACVTDLPLHHQGNPLYSLSLHGR